MSAEQELAIIKHKNERIEELIAVDEQLTNALELAYHVQDGYKEQVQMLEARVREVLGENARLTARVERLRGLCQSAAGWLTDAGQGQQAGAVLLLVGDMEAGATDCATARTHP